MSFVGPTTLQGWKDVPVRDRLAEATGLPAFIEVDLAAAAHGEQLYGLGSTFRDFYYLYFGVGLGGSMVHDGVALRGAWGNAGEIGHIPVVPGGDPCPCGNRGCLERYLSLEAYERRAKAIGEDAWLEEVAPILRSAVVTIENLFDPATIILGGLAPNNLLAKLIDGGGAAAQLDRGARQSPGRAADVVRRRPGRGVARRRGARRLGRSVAALRHHVHPERRPRRSRPDHARHRQGEGRMSDSHSPPPAPGRPQEFRRHRSAARRHFRRQRRRSGRPARRQRRRQVDPGQDHRRRPAAILRARSPSRARNGTSSRRPRPRRPGSRPSTRTFRSAPMSMSSPISSWAAS